MAGWMINCREYAELTSQSMDEPLSLWDRISIKIHQMICPPCKVVQDQFSTIRNACRGGALEDDTDDCRLSDDACQRIKTAIVEASRDKKG